MEATARTYRYLDSGEVAEMKRQAQERAKGGLEVKPKGRLLQPGLPGRPGPPGRAAPYRVARVLLACSVLALARAAQPTMTSCRPGGQRAPRHQAARAGCRPRASSTRSLHRCPGCHPFSNQKLSSALRQESVQPNSALAGEMTRRKEPLEAFPLDGMTMVGSLSRQGRFFALLKVDNLLYMVKQGDYLGQNYGRVTKIEETRVDIRELCRMQPASGSPGRRSCNCRKKAG
jgi:type IV pilus assembly protein PilP